MGGTTVSRGRRHRTHKYLCSQVRLYQITGREQYNPRTIENMFHQIKTDVSVLKLSGASSMKHSGTFDWCSSGTKAIFSLTIDRPCRFRDPRRRPPCGPPRTDANTINVVLKNRSGKKRGKKIDPVIKKLEPIGPRPVLSGIDILFAS